MSEHEILNYKFRMETAFQVYEFVRDDARTKDEVLEAFSLPNQTADLIKGALGFLEALNIVSVGKTLVANVKVKEEMGFKIAVLHAIKASKDRKISYLWQVWADILSRDEPFDTNSLLSSLKAVRRDRQLSDETMDDTGKFAILKPMITYLGIIGESSVGGRLRFHPSIDPDMALYVLKKFAGTKTYLQARDFLIWVNDEILPVITKGQPAPAIVNSLQTLEDDGSIRLDDPSDYREKLSLPNNRTISRVVIA